MDDSKAMTAFRQLLASLNDDEVWAAWRLASPGLSLRPLFIYGHFRPRRHRLAANAYRAIRSDAFKTWQQETSARHTP